MMEPMRRPSFIPPLVAAGVPLICVPCLHWAAVSRWGSEGFLWLLLVFLALVPCALILLVPSLIGLLFRRARRLAFMCLLCSLAYVLGTLLSIRAGESVRMFAFRCLANRTAPLISAIDAYDARYGHPPDSLSALIPEFIPHVPSTGMAAYPTYEYASAAEGTSDRNGGWEILINTPSGGHQLGRIRVLAQP